MRTHSLRFWLVLVILAIALVAITPVAIFIYSYGESITTSNLFDQLSVSLDDIEIRFDDVLDDCQAFLDSIVDAYNSDPASLVDLHEREDVVVSALSPDGSTLFSTLGLPLSSIDFSQRISSVPENGTGYATSFRYTSQSGAQIVINLGRKAEDGTVFLVDITGSQFVRYADPALVNEVCLIDNRTGMVSSLIHLDEYRSLEDGWVFSSTLYSDSGNMLITSRALEDYDFTLVGYLDISPYLESLYNFYALSVVVLLASCLVAIALAFILARPLSRPVEGLVRTMGEVEKGRLDRKAGGSAIREMNDLADKFNEMLDEIRTLMRNNEEERDKVMESERKALEAQMNPHFLFNTLNVIRSIARTHGESQIEDISIKLGRLLRGAVDNRQSTETLEQSFRMAESYLGIQQVRFSDRLHVHIHLDDTIRNVVMPKLIVQPLVENAVTHGLESKLGQWKLSITGEWDVENDRVVISVSDNGVGMDTSPFEDMEALHDSGHTGMYNVYRRLQLHYGKEAVFKVESQKGSGSTITLSFPCDRDDDQDLDWENGV